MKHEHATIIAEGLVKQLHPYCDKIRICGSIRRLKPDVKDIEIVCIPKQILQDADQSNLFGEVVGKESKPVIHPKFIEQVNSWIKVKGSPEGKYTQRVIPIPENLPTDMANSIKLDLFMANHNNYGCIELIRTGDWEFSKKFMGVIIRQGGYQMIDGHLKDKDGNIIPIPTEKHLFEFFNVPYIEPKNRNVTAI